MLKYLPLILFLFFVNKVVACTCAPQFDFKTKDDLKAYSFIALVQITKLSPNAGNKWMKMLRVNGNIRINIKEQFKGDTISMVHDDSYDNDCAFDMHEGEQWVLYGNNNKGAIYIDKCSFSRLYRDTLGKREWQMFSVIEPLNRLRALFGHTIEPNKSNKIYYANGKVEIEQSFKNGELNGVRKIYYPTGQLYVAEKFKDGKRVDYRNIYLPSGQLIDQTIYKNGFKTEIISYQDTAESAWYINYQIHNSSDLLFGDKSRTPAQYKQLLDSLRSIKHWDKTISMLKKFGADGRSYTLEMFDFKGDTSSKGYLDWNKRITEHTKYYRNKKIEFTMKRDQINDIEIEHDYDAKGKRKDFIKKCESCRFWFDEKSLPEATPEAIYY